MSIAAGTLTWEALAAAIAQAGQYATLQEAIDAGVVIVGEKAVTALSVVEGGAGVASYSVGASALDLYNASQLAATGANVNTASATLLAGQSGFKLAGMMTLDVGLTSAIAAPLAGVNLGANLYQANPELWTKISKTLLPFCYEEGKVEAFCDFVVDAETGLVKPIVLIATAIVDALKNLFEEEGVQTQETGEIISPYGTLQLSSAPKSFNYAGTPYVLSDGSGLVALSSNGSTLYSTGELWYSTKEPPYAYYYYGRGFTGNVDSTIGTALSPSPYTASEMSRIIEGATEEKVIPPTAGVSAPTVPVEPTVWPDTPIIVVPDPLGPDYQPIPVTPVTPLPLPPAQPVPQLPEHVPDPTPEKPEEWPEEEPWPTTIPFPFQPTEPDPDWPEVMPWPLPADPPSEWPLSPEVPERWPDEFPSTEPWPRTPEQWPEEVPWPDHAPENWPDGTPWPESPEEWPETIPWPVPWPENWPETAPWPIKWPSELPYPWPFPYPKQSPDPYTDPEEIEDPDKQVNPYIDPWPWQWPDPFPSPKSDPDPHQDPSQPESKPEIDPDPQPTPQQPSDPYPTPPEGTINPPPVPIIPLPFSSTTGLISVYHPTQSELLNFAQWLWVTWQDATIEKIWNNPFDGVITLFELYCTPTDVGRKNIRSGFLDSGVSSETISRYTELNCGSIGVPEFYGNYFDYAPYSKCHIFLPFIGIVELNVDDVVGHGVNVTYRIDEYNGSCIAMITCAKSTIVNGISVDYSTIVYQFSGNCAVELPIAGGSQAAIKAGMLEAAAWGLGSVIGGIMGGNSPMQIGQDLAYGAASAVHSVVSAKSSVQHSGSFGSSYGAMGGKKPYIIVTRPKQIQVPNYNELYGYQAHKMVRVGDCTGYLRCREVHVISPTASDEEKSLIEQFMKTGVYVTE